MTRLCLDCDPSQFGECVDPGCAAESPVAGCPYTAEWHLSFVVHRRAIDVADTRFDLAGQSQSARDVRGKDGRGQSVFRVVGEPHSLPLIASANQSGHGTETLLTKQAHLR